MLARAYVNLIEGWSGSAEPPGLVFVGSESAYTARVRRELARVPAAAERTRFVSGVSDTQLAALYRLASAVALPSLCEGFGFPPG